MKLHRFFILAGAVMLMAFSRIRADTITVYDNDGNGVESVVVVGSPSYDSDGALIDYEWSVDGVVISTGDGPSVQSLTHDFALGGSSVTLMVRDDVQVSSADVIGVIVLSSGANQPPVANAVVASTVDAPGGFSAKLFVNAKSSHDPENDPINRYVWVDSTTVLYDGPSSTATVTLDGLGIHILTLTVYSTDSGNVTQSGSKDFSVRVRFSALDPTRLARRQWTRQLGKDFSFSNIYEDYAGITFNSQTQTYFMTENQEDVILEIREDGSLVRTINIHGIRRPGLLDTDAEGIVWMHGHTYAMVLEVGEEMVIANITSTTTAISRSEVAVYDLFGDPKGIAYKASEDALYWVSQGTPMRVVKTKINTTTGALDTIFNHDVSMLPASDLADIAYFPSISPNMFLISQSTPVVMEVDVESETPYLASAFSLKPWPIPKSGGLTMNEKGQIIIVGKHAANTPEDDFNVFIPFDDAVVAGFALQDANAPPISINWVHPGGAQQAEFYFELAETGSGQIFIYDLNGEKVQEIRTPDLPAGRYRAPWDLRNSGGSSVASGVYFVLIRTPNNTRKEKLVIVR